MTHDPDIVRVGSADWWVSCPCGWEAGPLDTRRTADQAGQQHLRDAREESA